MTLVSSAHHRSKRSVTMMSRGGGHLGADVAHGVGAPHIFSPRVVLEHRSDVLGAVTGQK